MKTLIYDTETTGLPKKKASYSDPDFPRLVQIAWVILDGDKIVDEREYIVAPHGYTIPTEASDIHRVTQARAEKDGDPIDMVLKEFNKAMDQVDRIAAHNEAFDRNIVRSEFFRLKLASFYSSKDIVCTMLKTYKWVDAKHSEETIKKWPFLENKVKWCNMQELHEKLFNEGFEEAHDALVDVKALSKCYLELIKREMI